MHSEQNTPIDIYYNKLLDWLVDRRHCTANWQTCISDIRKKINVAIQDMPENEEITTLLTGTYINYFHCKHIVELLKSCGEGSTNFIGQYSSKRMKDWQEIMREYENENIYLAECAHLLQRNVNFEIPALKREIGKCQQIQRECARKEGECHRNSSVFKEKFHHSCKQMGIKGENIRTELLHLVNELPRIFNEIAEKMKLIEDAVNFYTAFVCFVAPNEETSVVEVTPLLKFMIRSGNATMFEWKTGRAPSKIEKDVETVKLEDVNISEVEDEAGEEAGEIDWGGDSGGIDFGDDEEAIDFGTDEIDFGCDGEENGINFGEDCEVIGAEAFIVVEDGGEDNPEGGVAIGNEALSVMENSTTRNTLINELLEVESFLKHRLIEERIEADMITVNQFQKASELVQLQTSQSIREMLGEVSDILAELTSTRMHNLYLIKSSSRYVERVADSLSQKLKISDNLVAQLKTLKEKSDSALEKQSALEPKISVVIEKTKDLQTQIAAEISTKYKNRFVNIMGEINTI